MADPEATTVHMGRMGLLEVEDKAEQTRQSRVAEGPESLTKLSNSGTYRRMCGLVGADIVMIPGHWFPRLSRVCSARPSSLGFAEFARLSLPLRARPFSPCGPSSLPGPPYSPRVLETTAPSDPPCSVLVPSSSVRRVCSLIEPLVIPSARRILPFACRVSLFFRALRRLSSCVVIVCRVRACSLVRR